MTRQQFISHVEATQEAFRRFLVALCCGDAALADDIAQEAYIKAYLSCDGLNNPERFNSWLFKIGYNTFANHKRAARIFEDYEQARHIPADTTDSPFQYQELYAALNRLSGSERSSILLFYLQGYSIKEIAEIQETSPEAVKQHLYRGRMHLRTLLSNK